MKKEPTLTSESGLCAGMWRVSACAGCQMLVLVGFGGLDGRWHQNKITIEIA